jgi:purine-nucleoside phosphorylase
MSSPDPTALTVESTRAYRRRVEEAAEALKESVSNVPKVGLVLPDTVFPADGAGLGEAFSAQTEGAGIGQLPGIEAKTVTPVVGTLADRLVVVLRGTPGLHDGYTPREVVAPVRMLAVAGVETLIFADTAVSVAPEIAPADLVVLSDHINFQGANPLVGPNVEDWGPRFPDMTTPYDAALRRTAEAVGRREDIPLRAGVYLAGLGPSPATRAEARMARTLGADVVGTRIVPEVIAARHMGVRVLAVSIVARRGRSSGPPAERAAGEAVARARPSLRTLLAGVARA